MAADWYCDINGEQHGPLTALQLKQLAEAGKLQPAHPVWKEGMTQRVPAKSVKGLFDSPAAAAKPSEPATAAKSQEEDLVEFEMVEETTEDLVELEELEPIEEEPAKSKKEKEKEPEEDEPEPELIAEVAVIYREGLPDLDGPIGGTLQVESTGLRFLFETDGEDDEYVLSFKKIDNVLEPVKGDFPPAMKKKALGKKIGGVAGKFAAGLVGKWMGGDAGKLVESAGKTAGNAAAASGNLGKPPRNRIAVLATVRKERCKIYFDTDGADRDEMNEEARTLYKQIQKARDKHAKTVDEGTTNINIVVNQAPAEEKEPSGSHKPAAAGKVVTGGMAALAPATMTAGKPFRVMSGGRTRGPFSLAELRSMIGSGQVGDADLIGVETWLPVATLGGLLAGGGAASAGGGGGSFASDEQADDDEIIDDDAFEDVEDEEEDIEVNAPAASSDDDAIPMDDEFQIG